MPHIEAKGDRICHPNRVIFHVDAITIVQYKVKLCKVMPS